MRLAYFDCASGISGDMTLGALIDLGVPVALLNEAVRSLLPQVCIEPEQVVRKGFRATLAKVIAPHEHVHRHLSTILEMIGQGSFSEENKERASDIFRLIAEAEAFVHGTDVEKVHFHEVGAADSIADIVGVVIGMDFLGLDEIRSSSVPTGCGTVEIAHGTCSVPAPATAELLRGIPIASSEVPFELTTPTGAALLKYYARQFGPLPEMTVRSIGIGAGSRDLQEQANILRILVGDTETKHKAFQAAAKLPLEHKHTIERSARQDSSVDPFPTPLPTSNVSAKLSGEIRNGLEDVWMVETNLDDLSGELVGYCIEQLWTLQPLDVWTTPIQMKKQRPGVTLSVLCHQDQLEAVESILFTETTTLGIRRWPVQRTILTREACRLSTPWGFVDAKRAVLPDGSTKIAPEFESARRLAMEKGISVREILDKTVSGC